MPKITLQEKLNLILLSFKSQLSIYKEFKDDSKNLKFLFSMNRSPLWDVSHNKFFRTDFVSQKLLNEKSQPMVLEHYFNRALLSRFIFDTLINDENMTIEKFTEMCKDLCSVIKLTKEEHSLVTKMSRGTNYPGYVFYEQCGIKIEGFNEFIKMLETKYNLSDWYSKIQN